jgi:hypothetical protein
MAQNGKRRSRSQRGGAQFECTVFAPARPALRTDTAEAARGHAPMRPPVLTACTEMAAASVAAPTISV